MKIVGKTIMKIRSVEDISYTIERIWNSNYMDNLSKELPWLKNRGYVFSNPVVKADLLITGINPSYRESDATTNIPNAHGDARVHFYPEAWGKRWDTYFGPLRKMLVDVENGINLMDRFDYLDIFHFKEMDQAVLHKKILKKPGGKEFAINEIHLTQHIIEDMIKPKLILVKNKESWAYWGKLKDKGLIWMGYDLEPIREYPCGELCRIKGLLYSEERVAPEITNENTSLIGTYVLFSKHINQYTKRDERPTASILNDILIEHG